MKNKRHLAGLVSGALLLSGALASTALAHHENDESAKSSIEMDYKPAKGKFVGQVSSGRSQCLGNRTVRLFKARNDAAAGTTHTNASGGWSLAVKKNTGRYYSKVAAETYVLASEVDKYGDLLWEHRLNCSTDRSDVEASA